MCLGALSCHDLICCFLAARSPGTRTSRAFLRDTQYRRAQRAFCSFARCEKYQQWLTDKEQGDSKFAEWKKQNTKECPKCKAPIEKNQGCNHVRRTLACCTSLRLTHACFADDLRGLSSSILLAVLKGLQIRAFQPVGHALVSFLVRSQDVSSRH